MKPASPINGGSPEKQKRKKHSSTETVLFVVDGSPCLTEEEFNTQKNAISDAIARLGKKVERGVVVSQPPPDKAKINFYHSDQDLELMFRRRRFEPGSVSSLVAVLEMLFMFFRAKLNPPPPEKEKKSAGKRQDDTYKVIFTVGAIPSDDVNTIMEYIKHFDSFPFVKIYWCNFGMFENPSSRVASSFCNMTNAKIVESGNVFLGNIPVERALEIALFGASPVESPAHQVQISSIPSPHCTVSIPCYLFDPKVFSASQESGIGDLCVTDDGNGFFVLEWTSASLKQHRYQVSGHSKYLSVSECVVLGSSILSLKLEEPVIFEIAVVIPNPQSPDIAEAIELLVGLYKPQECSSSAPQAKASVSGSGTASAPKGLPTLEKVPPSKSSNSKQTPESTEKASRSPKRNSYPSVSSMANTYQFNKETREAEKDWKQNHSALSPKPLPCFTGPTDRTGRRRSKKVNAELVVVPPTDSPGASRSPSARQNTTDASAGNDSSRSDSSASTSSSLVKPSTVASSESSDSASDPISPADSWSSCTPCVSQSTTPEGFPSTPDFGRLPSPDCPLITGPLFQSPVNSPIENPTGGTQRNPSVGPVLVTKATIRIPSSVSDPEMRNPPTSNGSSSGKSDDTLGHSIHASSSDSTSESGSETDYSSSSSSASSTDARYSLSKSKSTNSSPMTTSSSPAASVYSDSNPSLGAEEWHVIQ